MLSFERVNEGRSIQVCVDDDGIAKLVHRLLELQKKGVPDHIHLCSPRGGGIDLDDRTPFDDEAIAEVIVDYDPIEPDSASDGLVR